MITSDRLLPFTEAIAPVTFPIGERNQITELQLISPRCSELRYLLALALGLKGDRSTPAHVGPKVLGIPFKSRDVDTIRICNINNVKC